METKLNYEELEAHGNGVFIKDSSTNVGVIPIKNGDYEIAAQRAKLFAASPDLLKACIAVDKLYTDIERMVDGEVLEMLNQIRAAIIKAKGE